YLNNMVRVPTHLVGVDVRADLLEKHQQRLRELDWVNMTFDPSPIIDFQPTLPPNIILALHACDTATDDALAQGLHWQSNYIFSVPCCHNHLQQQLREQPAPPPFQPVLRHAILRERLGDILTDTFRVAILRMMGYQTDIVEFVSTEHTAKNLMIRAVRSMKPGQPHFVQEYQALKAFWQVTPYLETRLKEMGDWVDQS
ncbi:MAG: methyltransferase, partial [Chloroflexota bacterium]